MAQSLVESLAADFAPEQYEDDYKAAMQQLVEAQAGGRGRDAPAFSDDGVTP